MVTERGGVGLGEVSRRGGALAQQEVVFQGGVAVGTVWHVQRLRQHLVTGVCHLSIAETAVNQNLLRVMLRAATRGHCVVYCEAVVPGQQQSVVLSVSVGSERTQVAATFDLHQRVLDWNPGAVQHATFDPCTQIITKAALTLTEGAGQEADGWEVDRQVLTQVGLLDEGQQRLPVLRPQGRKLLGRGELAAGELQSQLQTLSPHVVVVLHPACTHAHTHTRHKFYATNHSAAPTRSCDVTNASQWLLAECHRTKTPAESHKHRHHRG